MKYIAALFILISANSALAGEPEMRCGWYDNSTPGNMTLTDRDAEWTISEQGGYEARGVDIIPDFPPKRWVITNSGEHGHGCACITGTFNAKDKKVLSIDHFKIESLSACRKDKTITEPEIPEELR